MLGTPPKDEFSWDELSDSLRELKSTGLTERLVRVDTPLPTILSIKIRTFFYF